MFENEDIFDVFLKVYASIVKGKVYLLIYEKNENVKVKVKTPVGVTGSADTGPVVTQGGVLAAVISSVSIGNGVSDAFAASDSEVLYESIKLSPQIFMDDIFRMAETQSSAQFANDLMENIMGEKSLSFNMEKSAFLIVGNKQQRKKLKRQVDKNPITLCKEPMKEVKVLKYLGDCVSYSLETSVHQTVVKRVAIVKLAVLEIRTVIEDTRADMFGAANLAFNIWELSILPMLLFNAGSWMGISKKTIKILDDLFHFFCRTIFRVSVSCPIPSYYIETGSLMFSNQILQKKLLFIRHLANLPEESLGRIVIEEQIKNGLPGL